MTTRINRHHGQRDKTTKTPSHPDRSLDMSNFRNGLTLGCSFCLLGGLWGIGALSAERNSQATPQDATGLRPETLQENTETKMAAGSSPPATVHKLNQNFGHECCHSYSRTVFRYLELQSNSCYHCDLSTDRSVTWSVYKMLFKVTSSFFFFDQQQSGNPTTRHEQSTMTKISSKSSQ